MSSSNVPDCVAEASVEDCSKTFINMLLLGESGVGKSTFINSFANYVQPDTIEDAKKSELLCLIPTQFTITDENYDTTVVKVGEDKNEDGTFGNSATQKPKSYVIPVDGNRKIRLIDTPGIGDNRGIKQDDLNFENILDFLGQYNYLHAICILLKPDVTRLSAYFEFCLLHLLSRLDKSAGQNIIFIFTNTRSTSYKPAGTMVILKKLLQKIEENHPYVKIPCNKKNIFCMDNEGFNLLVAREKGFAYTSEERNNSFLSWETSMLACQKILHYVAGEDEGNCIKPHLIRNTLSVNDVRRMINDLFKPLSEICDVIQENISSLNQHERDVARDGQSIEEFRKKLFIPSVILVDHKLKHPRTVCTSTKCTERIVINGKVRDRYTQICHEKCYAFFAPSEYKGSLGLIFCAEISLMGTCKECNCKAREHMRTYYDVEMKNVEEKDESVAQKIDSAEEQIRIQKELIAKLQMKKSEFEAERDVIYKCLAKFTSFLENHAIANFSDTYENDLDYLIERESSFGSNANQNFIDKHVTLKEQYQEEKRELEELLQNRSEGNPQKVTVNEVQDSISQLYGLKHSGEKIKELHLTQERMRDKDNEANTEYFHFKPILKKSKALVKSMTSAIKKAKYY